MPSPRNNSSSSNVTYSISLSSILKVVLVLLGIYVLYIVRDLILLLLISLILAAALNPLVEWLYSRFKFPRGLTVLLVYILFIALAVTVLSLLIPKLILEFGNLGSSISDFQQRINSRGSSIPELLQSYGLSNSLDTLGSTLQGFASNIFEATLGIFSGIFDVIAVLVISFYLVSQREGMKDFVKSLTPAAYHNRVGMIVASAQRKLGQWMLGQLSLMAIIFLLTYIVLLILNVKYALTLALLAGLLEIVPYLGPIISAIPAILAGLLTSPGLALLVAIVYIAIQQLENYVLTPRILGRSIGANPLIVLIALLVGFNIAGIIGMLIAAPLLAVAVVILEEFGWYGKKQDETPAKS
ncbi:MAG: AI-2E family transporter [Patescibacteria group bacterium]